MLNSYILDENGTPVVEPDIVKWAQWFETADRHVAEDTIGDVRISTVFLGLDLDHAFGDVTRSILYETMIFGSGHDERQWRYNNKVEALAGHVRAVSMVCHTL